MSSKVTFIDQTDSTNTYMAQNDSAFAHGDALAAHAQSAGRGQRGNTWESAPGENLTMSVMLRPEGVMPAGQFCISEAVAVGVAETLTEILGSGAGVAVKWPNDIYVADSKICGILIENVITGKSISRSIAGIGLNINQRRFLSDAPNPVSLYQLTGRTFSVDEIARSLTDRIADIYSEFIPTKRLEALHERYKALLWRRRGFYPYYDIIAGERIRGAISAIAPTGHLTLTLPDGTSRTYAFKEVAALLE
jgi:biotin--[acetyl-coA-carboxylase] ligase